MLQNSPVNEKASNTRALTIDEINDSLIQLTTICVS